jgi:hypothetical protein
MSPAKAMNFVSDAYQRFRLGRGTEHLARLFTDPDAIEDFRAILRAPVNSPERMRCSASS